MAKPMHILHILTKRPGPTLNYRLSQYVLSYRRCFSSKDDTSGEDKSQMQGSESRRLENNVDGSARSESSTRNKAKETAKKKLFSLLSELKVDSDSSGKAHSNLKLARAVKRPTKLERFKDVLEKQKKTPQDEIEIAAKAAAESVSGDPKDTLAELNEKLRVLNLAKQPQQPIDMNEDNMMKTSEDISQSLLDKESNKNIMSSVKEVAAAVADAPLDKNSLSQRLLRLSLESESSAAPRKSLDDLVKSMKVDKSRAQTRMERREQDERPTSLQVKQAPRSFAQTKISLFNAPPLDLPIKDDTKIDVKETVWRRLEENRLKLLVQFAPVNAFDEMMMWTEQGKHWKFPIDNETEMGEEENVGFHEHVFLEEHLHGFPTKGPVRHFMDLVVVGLSMNPYITVERKIENINWFRDYFKEKEDILQECGALG